MRAKQVDVHGRCGRHCATVTGDLVHHDHGLGHAQPGAAVFFRHGKAEPAAIGHRAVELCREPAVVITLEPILVVELGHDSPNAFADRLVIVVLREVHE